MLYTYNSEYAHLKDSPVEKARKAGPLGNGNWAGFDAVYTKISEACRKMALNPDCHLNQNHVDTMADLGSGHEERMKWRLHWLREYGWLTTKS